MENSTFAIVVPCFNEEEVLPQTNRQLLALLTDMMTQRLVGEGSYILYVDDGSRDRTWQIITEYSAASAHVRGLKLAGNVGHQNALMAGLDTAREDADVTVSIDADLQDDIHAIPEMVKKRMTSMRFPKWSRSMTRAVTSSMVCGASVRPILSSSARRRRCSTSS